MTSKTTHNKAARNGLTLRETREKHHADRLGQFSPVIIIEIAVDNADEYLAAYATNDDGSFTYHSSATHARNNDMPAHIRDEQGLRDLLPEFALLAAH